MRRAAFLAVLLVSACAHGGPQPFVPDTARLSPGQLGSGALDPDVTAVHLAEWAFAVPSRTHNDPADYIAGELNTSPRWANIGPLTKDQLLRGRAEVRRALGIPANAPSQLVVNGLAGAGNALAAGNEAAALAALQNPAFPNPQATLARLWDLPYMQMANVSTIKASGELFGPGNTEWSD